MVVSPNIQFKLVVWGSKITWYKSYHLQIKKLKNIALGGFPAINEHQGMCVQCLTWATEKRGKGSPGETPKREALRLCGCLGWKHWSRYVVYFKPGALEDSRDRFFGLTFHPEDSTLGTPRVRTSWVPRLRIHIHIHLEIFFTLRPRNNWRIQNETTVSLPAFFWPGWLVWYLIEQGSNRKWPKYQALSL